MKGTSPVRRFALLVALGVVSWSCQASRDTTSSTQNRAEDEAAIRALIDTNMAASNRHDAAGVAATYAADADLMAFAGGLIAGRDAIIQHEKTFFSGAPEVSVSTKIESVRFLTPDVALAENSTVHRFPRATSERATVVVVRSAGRWSIAAVRVLPGQERADMFSSDLLPTAGKGTATKSSKKK